MIDNDFDQASQEHTARKGHNQGEAMNRPELGDRGKDRITGFEGVITGSAEYISGCAQFLLVPKVTAEGAYREGQWIDEQRIEIIATRAVQLDNRRTPGPDKPAPKR